VQVAHDNRARGEEEEKKRDRVDQLAAKGGSLLKYHLYWP